MRFVLTLLALVVISVPLSSQGKSKQKSKSKTTSSAQSVNYSGTYELQSKTRVEDGEIYGYTGKIQIKSIEEGKLLITLLVNKGAPSYNMGTIVDTILLVKNTAVYTCPVDDPSCKITFKFDKKGVNVDHKAANYKYSCGFGGGVVATGFYKKVSSDRPVLVDPATNEVIPQPD